MKKAGSKILFFILAAVLLIATLTGCGNGAPEETGTTAPGTTVPGTTAPGTTVPGTTAGSVTEPGVSPEEPIVGFVFREKKDGTYEISDYVGSDVMVVIPAVYQGKAVTGIGAEAFKDCTSLTNIIIPDSVTAVAADAFSGCTGLQYSAYDNALYLGNEDNPYAVLMQASGETIVSCRIHAATRAICDAAFYGCNKLAEVCNESTLTITAGDIRNGYAGYYALNIYTPTVGESKFHAVGDYLFYEDGEEVYLLAYSGTDTVLTLPSYQEKEYAIYPYAFEGFKALTGVVIPDCVVGVGENAFAYCVRLAEVTLSNRTKTIGRGAFYGCIELAQITLPESVVTIEAEAFESCYKLIEVCNRSALTITAGDRGQGQLAYYARNVYTPTAGASRLKTVGDYLFYEEGEEVWLLAYRGESGTLTLPDYQGKVYRIYENAFLMRSDLISVTIPATVVALENRAFYGCTGLVSVSIADGVTRLGDRCFYLCTALENVDLGVGIISIGASAFENCVSLTGVVLPNGVESLGVSAFAECAALASVAIPADIKSLGASVFENCVSLTSAVIPDSVTSIGNAAFLGCTALESLTLPFVGNGTDEQHFGYIFGAFSATVNGNCVPASLKTVTLTDVSTLAASAFYGCSSLASVTVSGDVTSIGTSAFSGCASLASIAIPSGVTSIGASAFSGCASLASIAIPSGVTSLGASVFSGCASLASIAIPSGVTSLEASAFSGCSSLVGIVIPDGVTWVGSSAFSNCTRLTSVTLGTGLQGIGSNAFENCLRLVEFYNRSSLSSWTGSHDALNVYTPTSGASKLYAAGDYHFYVDGETVLLVAYSGTDTVLTLPQHYQGVPYAINAYAFYQEDALTEIRLSEQVDDIAPSAFEGCTSLQYNSHDKALYLGSEGNPYFALIRAENDSIASCEIHEDTKRILDDAFLWCYDLTHVVIGQNVERIDSRAFFGCNKLVEVRNLSALPITAGAADNGGVGAYALHIYREGESKLHTEGDYTFYQDGDTVLLVAYSGTGSSLRLPMVYQEKAYDINRYAFIGADNLTSITIPDSVTVIGEGAFLFCFNLTSVTLGTGIRSIGNSAFSDCARLANVDFPNGVTVIGEGAFSNCQAFTSITLPDSVERIGDSAFSGCTGLTSVAIGAGIESISDFVFSGCNSLASVTLPSGVASIGEYAFAYCTGLTSITIPDSVTSIGEHAFCNCTSLVEVCNLSALPIAAGSAENGGVGAYALHIYREGESKLHTVGDYTFYQDGETVLLVAYSGSETVLTLPENFQGKSYAIHRYAFSDCEGITSVSIPSTVTSIGEYAFAYCTGLTSITIPDSVTSIGDSAFNNCTGLTSVVLGKGVKSIGNEAFRACRRLEQLVIGESVESIGELAFMECVALTHVTIPDSVTSIGGAAFLNNFGLRSLVIGKNVSSIGDGAFGLCLNLVEVCNLSALPIATGSAENGGVGAYALHIYREGESKLHTVGDYTFYQDGETVLLVAYSGSETVLTLPENFQGKSYAIHRYAFSDCEGITSVSIPSTVTSIGEYAFFNFFSLGAFSLTSFTFADPNGWRAGDTELLLDIPERNALYLTELYRKIAWEKSVEP